MMVVVTTPSAREAEAERRADRRVITGVGGVVTRRVCRVVSRLVDRSVGRIHRRRGGHVAGDAHHAGRGGHSNVSTGHRISQVERCGAAHRRDLEPQRRARIVGHLHRELAAAVLVGDVVGHRAVLVEGLGHALLAALIADATAAAVDPVADGSAANHAQDRGCRPSAAMTDRVAQDATGNGADHRTGTGPRLLNGVGLVVANLARHLHLLHDGCAGDHPAGDVLGLDAEAQGGERGNRAQRDGCFHDSLTS